MGRTFIFEEGQGDMKATFKNNSNFISSGIGKLIEYPSNPLDPIREVYEKVKEFERFHCLADNYIDQRDILWQAIKKAMEDK